MPDDESLPQDDEELRRQIRAEIEARDQQRQQANQQRESTRSANEEAQKRRRIYQDEMRKYYQEKPGYREVMRDDGEVDWVPEAEAQQAAGLFEEVLEDPDEARSRMKWVLILTSAVVVIFIIMMYAALHERTGAIQVTSNVPQARIVLDTDTLNHFTGDLIKEVPAGEHVVTIALKGYRIQSDSIRHIKLKGGETQTLSFMLVPDTSAAGSMPVRQP